MHTALSKQEQHANLTAWLREAACLTGDVGLVAHGMAMALPPCEDITLAAMRSLAKTSWSVLSRRVNDETMTGKQLREETAQLRRERLLAQRDPANLIGVGASC